MSERDVKRARRAVLAGASAGGLLTAVFFCPAQVVSRQCVGCRKRFLFDEPCSIWAVLRTLLDYCVAFYNSLELDDYFTCWRDG